MYRNYSQKYYNLSYMMKYLMTVHIDSPILILISIARLMKRLPNLPTTN